MFHLYHTITRLSENTHLTSKPGALAKYPKMTTNDLMLDKESLPHPFKIHCLGTWQGSQITREVFELEP